MDIGCYDYDLIKYPDPYAIMNCDLSVPIPDGLPELLHSEIKQMRQWYRDRKYLHFEGEIGGLEGLVKNYHAGGEISDAQAKQIFRMFMWKW